MAWWRLVSLLFAHRALQPATAAVAPTMQVKESAGSETREGVRVSAAEEHELSGSKGTAHFGAQQ